VASGGSGASTPAGALIGFGLTATAAEINQLDGVTFGATGTALLQSATPADARLAMQGATTWSAIRTTASGTAHDFTGIPSWATEIEVWLNGVSLSGTDTLIIQLGTSGGFLVTDYAAALAQVSGATTTSNPYATGFHFFGGVATGLATGLISLKRPPTGNIWACGGSVHRGDGGGAVSFPSGSISLGADLTQLRLTRSGTNTFDAGSVCIGWR
jgi:hypothetical protein